MITSYLGGGLGWIGRNRTKHLCTTLTRTARLPTPLAESETNKINAAGNVTPADGYNTYDNCVNGRKCPNNNGEVRMPVVVAQSWVTAAAAAVAIAVTCILHHTPRSLGRLRFHPALSPQKLISHRLPAAFHYSPGS